MPTAAKRSRPVAKTSDRRQAGGSKGSFYEPTFCRIFQLIRRPTAKNYWPSGLHFPREKCWEAIRIANDSRFGLAERRGRTIKVSKNSSSMSSSGMVFIKSDGGSDPRVPFGGVKRSGYGRELSTYGIREFTNVKTVW